MKEGRSIKKIPARHESMAIISQQISRSLRMRKARSEVKKGFVKKTTVACEIVSRRRAVNAQARPTNPVNPRTRRCFMLLRGIENKLIPWQ